nr:MAG TPA: hypothetical protein [Bacteriophage sp.]
MKKLHDMAFPTGERKRPTEQAFDNGFILGFVCCAGCVIALAILYRIGWAFFGA